MCIFEQTQYLACGHNVESVTEKCPFGEKYRTSMHDKVITTIHSDDGKCETCEPRPLPETYPVDEELDGNATDPMIVDDPVPPMPQTNGHIDNPIDLTDSPAPRSESSHPLKRVDSVASNLGIHS